MYFLKLPATVMSQTEFRGNFQKMAPFFIMRLYTRSGGAKNHSHKKVIMEAVVTE